MIEKIQKHKVLVAGPKILCESIKRILEKKPIYDTILAEEGGEAETIIKTENLSLVIVSMNLSNMNGFALIHRMREYHSHLPYILLTSSHISEVIGLAHEYDVGYIISKYLKERDLFNIIHKLLNQNKLFGLKNYINVQEKHISSYEITKSKQLSEVSQLVSKAVDTLSLDSTLKRTVRLVFDEMVINAYYHAHGFGEEKKKGLEIDLPESKKILVQWGNDRDKFALSISDFEGTLSTLKVLKTLSDVIQNNEKMLKAIQVGEDPLPYLTETGRGFQIALDGASEFYVNIIPNQLTQILILFSLSPPDPSKPAGQSLKLIESIQSN